MASVTSCLRRSGCAALALLVLAVPAQGRPGVLTGCPSQPLAQAFLPWADPAWYALMPDGGLEAGGTAWTLTAGATVVTGNESYFVHDRGDARSLALPERGVATTPPVCLGLGHPTLRFFVKNEGSPYAKLTVSVVLRSATGETRSLPIGIVTGRRSWSPTAPLPVSANALALLPGPDSAFRFMADDEHGKWFVDDVYLDPYGKG
jgi:hypothetical protein